MAIYMAEYTIGGVNAADGVFWNLEAPATDRAQILEVGFFVEVAPSNPPQFGIKRRNAVGTGAITTATVFKADTADGTAGCSLETAWATLRPTVTGGSATRAGTLAAQGNGVIFNFRSNPIIVPVSAGVCGLMRNASGATTGTIGGYVIWNE